LYAQRIIDKLERGSAPVWGELMVVFRTPFEDRVSPFLSRPDDFLAGTNWIHAGRVARSSSSLSLVCNREHAVGLRKGNSHLTGPPAIVAFL